MVRITKDLRMPVPEFNTLDEFVDWYIENKPYEPSRIYRTDDASTTSLFKSGRFMVEMYMIDEFPKVGEHSHPNANVVLAAMGTNLDYIDYILQPILPAGQPHGQDFDGKKKEGLLLLAFSEWEYNHPVTTLAANWHGNMVGEKQKALVKQFYPNAKFNGLFVESLGV